jgi:regulator of sigma E protease
MLGITPALKRYTALGAVRNAAGYIWQMTTLLVRGLWDWITQKQEMEVTGPIGIASMSGRAMREGAWSFVTFLSMISLNLGLLNLLPFPALDGGRIVFVLLEILLRRRLPEKMENWIHTTCFVLLLILMVFVTWQDIYRLFWLE